MSRPRALDLFCGAGGVSVGLERAGFEVTAVDLHPMPHHRGGQFVQADAMEVLKDRAFLRTFDFVHASPPCQRYTSLRHLTKGKEYPDLVGPVRFHLERAGIPWSIENVAGAPLRGNVTLLCGTMFGLMTPDGRAEIRRHRLFETSFSIPLRPACQHGGAFEALSVTGTGMGVGGKARWRERTALRAAEGQACRAFLGCPRPATRLVEPGGIPVCEECFAWHEREVGAPRTLTVVGKKGLPGLSHERRARRALSVTDHTVDSHPDSRPERRRVLCVAGGKRMSGGMMTPQGALKRRAMSVIGHTAYTNLERNQVRETFSIEDARHAMGIDWMPMKYLSQAIPPAYAEWIGRQALAYLANL